MLHAMLWNEIHALQSVPPPPPSSRLLPAAMLQQGARAPSHGDQNERNFDTYRASARRAAWLGRRSKYSLLEYALRGARANGLVRASLLNRQGVEVRAGAPRSQRASHLGVSGVRAP